MNKYVKPKALTASGQVTLHPGKVRDIAIVSDGANVGTVKLLDNSTDGTGGTEIWYGEVPATAGNTTVIGFPEGCSFLTNCYAVLTNVSKASIGYTDNA